MKKIFFVINSLKYMSGTERVACTLSNLFNSKFGYSVTIINRDTEKSNVAYILNDNIKVKRISGNAIKFYNDIKKYTKENKPDYIIVHNMGKLTLLLSLMNFCCPFISLEHVSFTSRPNLVKFLSKFLYKKVSQVITLTENDKKIFLSFHDKVDVIPNISPFSIYNNKNDKDSFRKIIAIGRLTDQKNFIHLLQAWKSIYKKLPGWSLFIYGEGEQKSFLQSYIDDNLLKDIYLKGITTDIKSVYEKSSLFLMSSKYEGLPMVLIEAQSFGLPIVSYDCPNGPSDVVKDSYNGFLVPDQNIEILSKKIYELASSSYLIKEFSKNSLENAANFQPTRILEIWANKVFKEK